MIDTNPDTAAFTSYYTFYLIERFGIEIQLSQIMLFLYLVVGAIGVIVRAMIGDRIGRDRVIWLAILGSLPFALMLPHADLFWTGVLSIVIGFIIASAFPAIVVYGQELMPRHIGTVSGFFFGFAFGVGGLGAALLGKLADLYGIIFVYQVAAFLPALGVFAVLLPDQRPRAVRLAPR